MRILRAADQQRVAWRNGAGLTTELAGGGAASDFAWRVSLADVVEDCEFSVFPDVDRTIVLVEGDGMVLELDGVEHELTRFVPFGFDGGAAVRCRVAGPTRDLNLMTRRGRASGTVAVESAPLTVEAGDHLVVVCLEGSVGVEVEALAETLAAGDVMELDGSARITGAGRVAVIRVRT
ncbi:HutD family protein [Kribbella sp. NPDC051770]|uniref:HutD/Ves family protein n=1 Tax=Kribbella sp. NPDC051770 TaxID=3155413 RepID=UPI00342A32B1